MVFNKRLTSTAGRATPSTGLIELSEKLYNENKEEFMRSTIPHEVAHIVACRALGSRGHDAAWLAVMFDLGLEGNRCHTYKVERRSSKVYTYNCGCMKHEFTPQRHAWAVKGKRYVCKHCKSYLVYTGE